MSTAFIGVGSNLGDKVENCKNALSELSGFVEISAVSSFYETEPVGKREQPDFINCVVKVKTELSPYELLSSLQYVEYTLGRRRTRKWEPRVIDLDILFYDNLLIETGELIIPHPEAYLRRFVLEPLCEIAPDLVHPVFRVSVSELLSRLEDSKRVVKLGGFSTAY